MRRIVLGRVPTEEAETALERNAFGTDPASTPGAQDAPDLRDERVGKLEMLEQLPRDDRVEAAVVERQRLDVRLHRLDAERRGFLERVRVDVEADDEPLEEVPRQRARAAAEVEHPLAAADGGDEQRDAFRHEDEVALVPMLPMMLS